MSVLALCGRNTVLHDVLVSVGKVKIPQTLIKNDYTVYDVLGIAIGLADRHYYKEAVHAIEMAESMAMHSDSPNMNNVISATWSHVLHYKIKYNGKEYLFPVIKNQLTSLVPGASWIEPYSKFNRRPDVVLTIDGKLAVGEVRPNAFTKAHLKQLCKNMQVFDTNIGFAFAKSLTTNLPQNVTFIDVSGLQDGFYKQPL